MGRTDGRVFVVLLFLFLFLDCLSFFIEILLGFVGGFGIFDFGLLMGESDPCSPYDCFFLGDGKDLLVFEWGLVSGNGPVGFLLVIGHIFCGSCNPSGGTVEVGRSLLHVFCFQFVEL